MKVKNANRKTWSFRLGRMLGVDVYVHFTFLLLLGFIGVAHGLAGRSVDAALTGVLFFAGIFLCVLPHEFGHVLAARHYGIKTKDITLLPIGGLARLERIPEKPVQELVVALTNPMLLLIALFVWIGASQEAAAVEMKSAFDGVPVREAMVTQFETLSPQTILGDASQILLAGSQRDFPVVERGQVVGLLTRERFFEALRDRGESQVVAEVMERSFQVARPDDLLDVVMGQSQPERLAAVPVLHNGRIAGLLTPDNLGELYMISAALRARGAVSRIAPPVINRSADVAGLHRPIGSPLHD